jgi:hypothetical protein
MQWEVMLKVLHEGAQQLLARSHRDMRRIPRCGEIVS